MPKKIDWVCYVTPDGRLSRTKQEAFDRQIAMYADSNVRLQIGKPKRSSDANKYYWYVIKTIQAAMAEAGYAYSQKGLHKYFKEKYLSVEAEVVMGVSITHEPSTTRLDSTEFFYYVEAVKNDEAVLVLGINFDDPPDRMTSFSISDPV